VSSHREAPEIAKDPVADSTDLYAFVSPDRPDTVTLIANYVPLQAPAGGPNFYEFGDDVLYEINVDNDGDGDADISYQFRFTTKVANKDTFLYNTGPIESLSSPNWNRRQTYTVTRVTEQGHTRVLGTGLACPPCNIGPLSTPHYPNLARAATHTVGDYKVFAGQRAEGFYVDLGSIFDLLNLRPFEQLNLFGGVFNGPAPGVNTTNRLNVHSIALQVPVQDLIGSGSGKPRPGDARAVVGVWTSASRRQVTMRKLDGGNTTDSGPFVQVSRLGNPLFNEVIVPMAEKDLWNSLPPSSDKQFTVYVEHPEVAGLLPVLYPGVFPHLAALNAAKTPRADLVAILLTGLPAGIVPGFQNYTGAHHADMLRLNTAIAPAANPSIFGVLGGDLAGFPNGRRVQDDVVSIELRAIAGLTVPLVKHSFTPDAAAGQLTDGLTPASVSAPFLSTFPYLGVPYDGFHNPS